VSSTNSRTVRPSGRLEAVPLFRARVTMIQDIEFAERVQCRAHREDLAVAQPSREWKLALAQAEGSSPRAGAPPGR
jgi:hypothetical protein